MASLLASLCHRPGKRQAATITGEAAEVCEVANIPVGESARPLPLLAAPLPSPLLLQSHE